MALMRERVRLPSGNPSSFQKNGRKAFDRHAVRFYLNLRPSRSFARRRLGIGVSGECHAAPGIPDYAFQDKLLKSTPLGCAPLRPILAGQKAGQANANEAPADQA